MTHFLTRSFFWLLLATTCATTSLAAQQHAAFMRGMGSLWGSNGEAATLADLNAVFSGSYDTYFFETAAVEDVFSGTRLFVYMEGGDQTADALEAFLDAHRDAIEAWVLAGGRLYVNSAPNVGDGMAFPFRVDLLYDMSSPSAVAVNPGDPAFNGPWDAETLVLTGGSAAHAHVQGKGLVPILRGSQDQFLLGRLEPGKGLALFGGMTTTNYWNPDPAAEQVRRDIMAYACGRQIEPKDVSLVMKLGFPGPEDKLTDKLKLQLKHLVLPRGSLDGVPFSLDIGGPVIAGTLGSTGKYSQTTNGTQTKLAVVPGPSGSLRATLTGADISKQMDNPFFRPLKVKLVSEVLVRLTLDGVTYEVNAPVAYVGKPSGGKLKSRKL